MNRTVKNGCLVLLVAAFANFSHAKGYRTVLGAAPDEFPVVVVSGTPREMGFALGSLMKPEITAFAPRFYEAAQRAAGASVSSAALDAAWQTMEPFISPQFKEELAGLSEGCGLPLSL